MSLARSKSPIDDRLAAVLATHFDPDEGSPYWLDVARRLGFDPREEIRAIADLPKLGWMDRSAMRDRPLMDFLPRRFRDDPRRLIVVQSAGTLGQPLWTSYARDEFGQAFVDPFVAAARHVGFPPGGRWLFVGPTGPHVIGRAARAIALATGAHEPFTIDFDSRWARKMVAGSFAARRYLEHIVSQAMDVIAVQPITHLFSTPPVLEVLAERMSPSQRDAIRGVHYGGMPLSRQTLEWFQRERFPRAVHLSGYGNTLFGCCLELNVEPGRELRYFPHQHRIVFGLLNPDAAGEPGDLAVGRAVQPTQCLRYDAVGETGTLVFSRLDETVLLANFVERDRIRLVPPPAAAPAEFDLCGVASPQPVDAAPAKSALSIY